MGADNSEVQVPKFFEYFQPILDQLEEHGGSATNSELEEWVADAMDLSEEQRSLVHEANGGDQTEIGYRMAWARSYLKKVGYLENVERAVWSLTSEGKAAVIEDPMEIVYQVRGAEDDTGSLDDEGWEQLVQKAREEPEPPVRSVRELLRLFGHRRRGKNVVRRIRSALRKKGLETWPPFDRAHIDARVEIQRVEDGGPDKEEQASESVEDVEVLDDPVPRIAQLAAADRVPTSVKRDEPIERATTLMMQNDFSQLPVLNGERTADGFISWETIGQAKVRGEEPEFVREAMEPHPPIVNADVPLIEAVTKIEKYQFVLVRGPARKIRGPVTTADITDQFHQLAEPFLRIGQIEGQLRRLLCTLPDDLLAGGKDPSDDEREVDSITDLTFGEYLRLLENPDVWNRLGLAVDRKAVVRQLDRVRQIRNRVMHFDPDPLENDEQSVLYRASAFLNKLVQ